MQVLETDAGVRPLLEPDNEGISAPAIWGKRRAGRFPALQPGDRDDAYRGLWAWILDGAPQGPRQWMAAQVMRGVQPPARTRYLQGRRVPLMDVAGTLAQRPGHRGPSTPAGGRLLVKSVHTPLAVEWLADEFDIDVLVLLRHPGNVLASWLSLDLNERFVNLHDNPSVRSHFLERWQMPPPGPDPLERTIWEIGVLTTALEESVQRHPEWLVRTHEELCLHPRDAFGRLFTDVGLSWTDSTDAYLAGHDRPGEGFFTQRVAAELPDSWTRRLSAHQIAELQRVLAGFPLDTWDVDGFSRATDE